MIAQKEVELANAKAEEAKYYDEFCQRVRSMEERGSVSYWAVLFNSTSFSDLLDQINAISEVMDYDNQVMDQLAAARQAVDDAKADLEKSKADEEAAKANLEAQKADLVSEQAKVDAAIQEINSQSSVYEEQLHEAEADASGIASQIAQAEKTYQAQIAAQKKAEEEARKKAAADAAAAAAAANKNNGGSTNTSTNENTGTSSGGSGSYLWPLAGYTRVSSPFGYRICPYHGQELHGGCDIPPRAAPPIRAAKKRCGGDLHLRLFLWQLHHHRPQRWLPYPVRPSVSAGGIRRPDRVPGTGHWLCGFYRQLHRQPPAL